MLFLTQAITVLSEANVAYCVVGGLAVSMHGIPRTTPEVVERILRLRRGETIVAER